MKTIFTFFGCVFFAINSFGQVALPLLEEFNVAPNENQFGVFSFNNYGSTDKADPNYTAYTIEQDKSSMLSGTNCAKMNIGATGNQWWTIQVRLENIVVNAGDKLEVKFLAVSSMNMSFVTVLETTNGGHDPFNNPVQLKSFESKSVSFTTPAYLLPSKDNFIIALGNSSAIAGTFWVDSVSIKLISTTGIKDITSKEKWNISQRGNQLQIEGSGKTKNLKVEFYTLLGQKIASQNVQHLNTSTITLPEYYNNTIYIVRLLDDQGRFLVGKKILPTK
ncbi:MAG: hypothetical protein WCI54_12070 [Bacteroidia bacterium]